MPEVRRAIALALGKLDDRESLDLLIAALRDARTPEPVRDAALEAVEMIGTEKAVEGPGRAADAEVPPGRPPGAV